MPLVNKWWLSTKAKTRAWVEPVADRSTKTIRFEVRVEGTPPEGTIGRRGARCITCSTPVSLDYVRAEGRAGRMFAEMIGMVADAQSGRVYLPASEEHIQASKQATPAWIPEGELAHNPRDLKTPNYGMRAFADLFTPRQLIALTTFSDLVGQARNRVLADAINTNLTSDGIPLSSGGSGADAYADAIATYLAEAVSKLSTFHNTLAYWRTNDGWAATSFGRQVIPLTWNYAEVNPFGGAGGNFREMVTNAIPKVLSSLPAQGRASVEQGDAAQRAAGTLHLCCTDPPYYDNIGYADLSDFFYVWLRPTLGSIYPELFGTLVTPKGQELTVSPYRFGGNRGDAQNFFEKGLALAFTQMRDAQDPAYPLIIFYAFKQAEEDDSDYPDPSDLSDGNRGDGRASTGWETMLEGLVRAGFQVDGTWPMRTESQVALKTKMNTLASSIVLVCRALPAQAKPISRGEFIATLRRELPHALKNLQEANIAPVDLAQAAIGPGMGVFSRHPSVLEADGKPMKVRTALTLINHALDEVLAEQEGEFDVETRWAIAWFDQHGVNEGLYGVAETLSKAKDTSVAGMAEAGIIRSGGGKVRLLRREELPPDWVPRRDGRLTVWEVTQHLIKALNVSEHDAAALLAQVGDHAEAARDLAYRLYITCERKSWTQEALGYNSLVVNWPVLTERAARYAAAAPRQSNFLN